MSSFDPSQQLERMKMAKRVFAGKKEIYYIQHRIVALLKMTVEEEYTNCQLTQHYGNASCLLCVELDSSSSGMITKNQIAEAMKQIDSSATTEQIQELLKHIRGETVT